jgi:hypothetical protein
MNKYKFPYLNPIRFHQVNIGDFAYNQIPSFEYKRGYNQVYFHTDLPYIQILSEVSNPFMKIEMLDVYGTVKWTWWPSNSGMTYDGWFVWHWISYFPYAIQTPSGIYVLKITISDSDGTKLFYSEPINLVDSQENTLKLVYTHDQNEFDIRFLNTPFSFMMRVEGGVKSDGIAPGGKFTMFQDLDYQSVMLQSQPFNVEKYTFGDSYGIPNWMADKINRIFGLTTVKINDIQYSRNEGAKIERVGDSDYPLAGWTIDLVKTANPYSEQFEFASTLPFTADTDNYTADSTNQTADQTLI